MVAKFKVAQSENNCIDETNEIDVLSFEVWGDRMVIDHRKPGELGLDFDRGDIRLEFDKNETIKLCKSILFAFGIEEKYPEIEDDLL